jgi:N-acetylneuraminic acid mutarotase
MPQRPDTTSVPRIDRLECRRLLAAAVAVDPPAVVGRHLFYNNSAYDGRTRGASAVDDRAVAPDKSALLPGNTGRFENVTSYARGINGVMVDIAGLPADAALDAGDFIFRVGVNSSGLGFATAPPPSAVAVRRGAGVGGSDRVTLTWPDRAVRNSWLEVTVLANRDTGLESPDVFFFGNLVGETGNLPLDNAVAAPDYFSTRARLGTTSTIVGRYDFDRNGRVGASDLAAVRFNFGKQIPFIAPAAVGVWQTGANVPIALAEVAGGVIGNKLYLVGQGNAATLSYDLTSGAWSTTTAHPPRPHPGNHHAAEVVNGRLYVIGGFGSSSNGKVQIFDPATNAWALGAAMPFAAGSGSSAVINGQIYVAGGIIGSTTTTRVARYNPATNTWAERAPMPQGRNHAASATDGQKLYVFGGRGAGSGDSNVVANGFNTVQIYDPAANTWQSSANADSTIRPLPQARGGMGKAVFYRGEFYVVGGETASGAGATATGVYNRVDVYNPTTNTWRLDTPMPTARHGIFPVLHDNRILVAAGGVIAGASSSAILETLYLPRV